VNATGRTGPHVRLVPGFPLPSTREVEWFRDDRNRDEAINVLVTNGKLKPDEVAKSYDFFRKGEFFEPTGSVSKAKNYVLSPVSWRGLAISQAISTSTSCFCPA